VILHTVLVSYKRPELTVQAIASFFETVTVTVPFTFVAVDNGSGDDSPGWAALQEEYPISVLLLGENRYPGYACNRGFDLAPPEATVLHRADNDFVFLPGWDEVLQAAFETNPRLGQVGLRTDDEELHNPHNVGGNCAFRREIWREGLRWDERPWPKIKTAGYTEDSYMSPSVRKAGWEWGRVAAPCIQPISFEDFTDPYYVQSYADRKLVPPS
jgi:GT2 family glycosyltransferase